MICKLFYFLNKKQRLGVAGLTVMIFVGAALETLGVSAIIPIVDLFMQEESDIKSNIYISWIQEISFVDSISEIYILLLMGMIGIYIIKNLYLLFLTYVQANFVNKNKARVQGNMLSWYLNRPYVYFLNADISIIHRSIRSDIDNVFAILLCVMQILTEVVVSISIGIFLLVTDWRMTIILVVLLGGTTLFVTKVLKNRIGFMGRKNQEYIANLTKWELQSMHGIKNVKVLQCEKYFDDGHRKTLMNQSRMLTRYAVYNSVPKLLLETVCIGGILGYMIVCIGLGENISRMLTSLSAFAIAAFRVLPSVSRISTHLSNISYYNPSLDYIYNLIKKEAIDEKDMKLKANKDKENILSFKDKIQFEKVTFSYPGTTKKILDEADMVIPYGASVGIKGPSGAGKTTVVDVLLGLLKMQTGEILCDGIAVSEYMNAWLSQVGYISQSVYMLDDSIRANVAFGIPKDEMNEEKVRNVLKEAQLLEFTEQLPEGLDTKIGEQGVRLSGGQKQRIGIARALYRDPEVLIFDEATSALDNDTEAAVMAAIDSFKGKKTMIIIAHRLRTIENCDIIYEVKDGKIVRER